MPGPSPFSPCFVAPVPPDKLRRAAMLLDPFIDEVRRGYLAFGLGKIERVKVKISEEARDGLRHFAMCRTDGGLIVLSPDVIGLPVATAQGIIAHEFGHAADYLYPGAFQRAAFGKAVFHEYGQRSNDGVPQGVADRWRARTDDEIELDADAIAETVLKVKIGYAGPCMLETIGAGVRPRPPGLR
jgi:hypothetical protein